MNENSIEKNGMAGEYHGNLINLGLGSLIRADCLEILQIQLTIVSVHLEV